MELHQITSTDLQALVDSGIVQVQGISGIKTTVDIAKQTVGLVQMHAMSGEIYDIVAYIPELDTFNVELIASVRYVDNVAPGCNLPNYSA